MNGLDALARASAGFEQRLSLVGPDDWTRPTPCTEWNVWDLVNHVVGGNVRYRMVLHGASDDEVTRTRTADHLGDDALSAFVVTLRALEGAFAEDGAFDRTVRHPVIGELTGAQLLDMRVTDITVHTWDIARALRADETLDPVAVEFSLASTERRQSPQERLIRLSGRNPEEEA